MKKARKRFLIVAFECATRILPYLAAWILRRLVG
jgi:hypothetical protein